jgi:hypothetical protein
VFALGLTLLIAATTAAPAQTTETTPLPSCPAQRAAVKAMRGDFGPLAEWQRVAYRLAYDSACKPLTAWLTQYYPSEGYDRGETCASGYGCSERVAAATSLPLYSLIYIPGVGVRQVLDTGASFNDPVARRKGADLWVDVWVAQVGDFGFVTDIREIYVIRRGGPK